MNVDWFLLNASPLPTLAKIASTTVIVASFAGTYNQQCAIKTMSAFCLKNVDLPPMLGPVNMWINPLLFSFFCE
jgi:hypothetical protein